MACQHGNDVLMLMVAQSIRFECLFLAAPNGHAVPSGAGLLLKAKRTLRGYRFWSVSLPGYGSHSCDLNPVKVRAKVAAMPHVESGPSTIYWGLLRWPYKFR